VNVVSTFVEYGPELSGSNGLLGEGELQAESRLQEVPASNLEGNSYYIFLINCNLARSMELNGLSAHFLDNNESSLDHEIDILPSKNVRGVNVNRTTSDLRKSGKEDTISIPS
jgi:hypothetical protein